MVRLEQSTISFLNRWYSVDGPRDFSVQNYRTAITDLIDSYLTDLDEVAQTLGVNGDAHESRWSLNGVQDFVGESLDIFLHCCPDSLQQTNSEISVEEKTSHAFSFWFLRHLLRVLCRHDCSAVHAKTIKLIQQILHAILSRSKNVFVHYILEFIDSSAEIVLSQCPVQFYNGMGRSPSESNGKLLTYNSKRITIQPIRLESDMQCSEKELIQLSSSLYSGVETVSLTNFDCDIDLAQQSLKDSTQSPEDNTIWENKMKKVEIVLTEATQCELLQANLTKILHHLLLDICQYVTSHVDALWGVLCCQFEEGDFDLKMVSIQTLTSLLNLQGFPRMSVREYFLSCLIAFWELLCTNDAPLDTREREQLEQTGARLTTTLITQDKEGHLASTAFFLRDLVPKLCSKEFLNIFCTEAKQAVISLLVHVLKNIACADPGLVVNRTSLDIMTAYAMSIFDSERCSEYMVPLLVHLTLLDANISDHGSVVSPGNLSSQGSTTPVGRPGALLSRKRQLDLPTTSVKLRVFSDLVDKMNNLGTDKPPAIQKLECLHVIVRVASECLVQLHRKGQPRYPLLTEPLVNTAVDSWSRYLRNHTDTDIDQFKETYITILNSIAALLLVNDIHPLPAGVLQELSWMVTYPWIAIEPPGEDVRPPRPKEVAMIASQFADRLDNDCICLCLKTMVLLPRDTISTWKVHIIKQTISDNKEELTRTVVQCFPLLLLNLELEGSYLVKQLLVPLLDNAAVCEHLAERFDEVMLTVVGAGQMERPSPDTFVLDVSELRITFGSKFDKKELKEKSKYLDPSCVTPFMNLLKHAETKVRKSALHSLATVFQLVDLSHDQVKSMISSSLYLLEDPDKDVRMECCSLIAHLVSDQARSRNAASTDHMIWHKLKSVCIRAHDQNRAAKETILMSVGQFGRLVEGELLESVIVCLLEHRLSLQPVVDAVAFEELQEIASFKGESLQQIYVRFKPGILKFLVELMYTDQLNTDGLYSKKILISVAGTLAFDDLKAFLQGSEKYIIPFLVSKASPEATKLIKFIASQQSPSNTRRSILINNTKYIFTNLVKSCQKDDMERALLYLQTETDFSLGNLLRLDFQRVHNELLLHLSTHYQQVFTGLKILADHDEQYKGPKDIDSDEQMAEYLRPRLLGVLAFFDSQLMNSNITLEDKELALKSLISIITLMGSKHICYIRYKVMNTLRLGLQFTEPSFAEISCRAWNCLVRSFELPMLGAVMSQIIATLLPLLKVLPAQVAQVFNYMIVENRNELSAYFQEIYFLPDIPELAEANKILRQFGESCSSNSDLKTLLAHFIKGINHESLDVRVHALPKLRKILKEKRMELSGYVLNSEPAEPILSELITALLIGCRDADYRTQILCGQCLGELGAIDAGRLELISNSPDVLLANFHPSINEESFASGLINVVVKAFLAATEPRVQDSAAFALQELLQIYKISEPGDDQNVKPKGRLWDSFPDQTKEILIPLLNSKYKLTLDVKYANYPRPLFRSDKGKNFKDWVSNWTGYLISKVKPGMAYQVFKSCSAAKRHSQQVALYILPHIILCVLQNGSAEHITEMYEEVMEVLQHLQKPDMRHETASNFHHMSAQTVFSILDYLTMWRSYQVQNTNTGPSTSTRPPTFDKNPDYLAVDAFLKRIPQDVIAHACFNCKAYTRALRHFEMFVSGSDNIQQHLDSMQRIYVAMDEPDGVLGAAAVRLSQPTLMQQILTHESLGQQQDAQACYERAIQMEPKKISNHHGLLRSLMDLAQPYKALAHTAGILAERRQWTAQLNSYRIEAAWKLGSWDELEEGLRVEQKSNCNWPVLVGRILLAYKDRHETDFIKQLELSRKEQMGPLSAASMEIGSYHRGYENILRLHMISEIEEFFHVLVDFPEMKDNTSDVIVLPSSADLLADWQCRLQMAQSSFRAQEPILTLRRTLLSMVQSARHPGLDTQIGKWWLWSAKVARKAGYLQAAYGCLIQASSYNLPEFYVEKAKWLYAKGQKDDAISYLDKGISEHFGDMSLPGKKEQLNNTLKEVYAQSLLLYGKYSEETSHLETNTIIKQYKDVIDICPDWEDGHFHLAKYYDKIMNTIIDDKDKIEKQGEFIIYVVRFYGNSLKYGNQHIYHSLPRLLSLWLDYGTAVVEIEKRERGRQAQKLMTQKAVLKKINETIEQLSKQLAQYQMFTAFPQLISRICHAQAEVFQQLEEIISNLLITYPHQAMWMMMAVSKSSYQMRVTRCTNIFTKAIERDKSLAKFIQDCKKLTDRLLEMCEKDFGTNTTISLSQSFKPLKRLLEDSNFSQILLPLQSLVTVKLPSTVTGGAHHSPFPDTRIYIKGFSDVIEVLPSLQKPKKITMIGSDGKQYVMMCKPKDDLRKDCRLMEFNTIVNRFLRRDAECRKRQLKIRTYTVTPLNEECGLIEWVNNTTGLRYVLVKLYKERGLYMSGKELKSLMPSLHSSVDTKMKLFKEKLLPRHPPLFPEWFNRTFPDPTSWYNARVSYARTTAVMSIVGYILGLGDRHGENILFDSNTGDCVHVDFNCLFNKGETFEWPERVPFRLTHNMAAALGPLGCEGLFRRACEMTLKVIRDQMDPLMSVLKPFIYDPLVEWSKSSKGQRTNATDSGEINNELALIHVQNIEDRMRGILKTKAKPRCLPLSIEGHVKYLIQEATSNNNLCQMYIGWAAYM